MSSRNRHVRQRQSPASSPAEPAALPSIRDQLEIRKLQLEIQTLQRPHSFRGWFVSILTPTVVLGVLGLAVAWYTGLIDVKRIALEKASLENQRAAIEKSLTAAEEKEAWFGLLDQMHAHIQNIDPEHGFELALEGALNTSVPSPPLSIDQVRHLLKPPNEAFAKQMEHVSRLTLQNIQPEENALAELLSLPSLTECSIYTLRSSGQSPPKLGKVFAAAVYKSQLTSLDIGAYSIDKSILSILLTAPSLESLSFQNMLDLNDESFAQINLSSPLRLKNIRFRNTHVSGAFAQWLPPCPELGLLSIEGGKQLAPLDLRPFNQKRFPELTQLSLGSATIADWSPLASLTGLKVLWLDNVAGTSGMVDQLPESIKSLSCFECDLTPQDLKTIRAKRPEIKALVQEINTPN